MNPSPSISVIIPAYNAAEYLAETLACLQSQSFTDWEAVIVDDCSEDATFALANTLSAQDCRIRVFRLEKNSGTVFEPRRRAALEARGRYLAALDADDLIDENYLRDMLQRAESTGASMVCPSMWSFVVNISEAEIYCPGEEWDYSIVASGKDLIKYTLLDWRIGCGGCLYDAEMYRNVIKKYDNGYRTPFIDEVFTRLFLLSSGKVAFCNSRYYYRVNPSSITRKVNLRQFYFLTNDLLLADIINNNFEESSEEKKRMEAQYFNHYIDYLRLLPSLPQSDIEAGIHLLEKTRSHIPYRSLSRNPYVSPRLLAISKAGVRAAAGILKWYDKLQKLIRRQ